MTRSPSRPITCATPHPRDPTSAIVYCVLCTVFWQNDRVGSIGEDLGNRTSPPYVSCSDNKHLIDDATKNHIVMCHTTTSTHRPRKFYDSEVQADAKHFSFSRRRALIWVEYLGEEKNSRPKRPCEWFSK
ncbi:hypothetical protein B0H13DRAFT_2367239 [Mycena leptocephala]|nr:hypothetical protein B0H13DRAFT_2367239 [Mycena leptocephala]